MDVWRPDLEITATSDKMKLSYALIASHLGAETSARSGGRSGNETGNAKPRRERGASESSRLEA